MNKEVFNALTALVGGGEGYPDWMVTAHDLTGIPYGTLVSQFVSKGTKFYNTDGLVFMLDMCHECSAEKWTDLVGKNEFVGSGVTLQDGVPYISSSSAKYTCGNTLTYNYGSCTLEIVYKADVDNSSSNRKFFGTSGSLAFGILGNNRGVIASDSYCMQFQYTSHGSLTSASVYNDTFGYFNQTKKTAINKNAWGSSNVNFIGNGGNYNGYTGKSYAIRIYNRQLTEAEVLANQSIDLARFSNI